MDSRSVKKPRWPSLHEWADSLATQTWKSSLIIQRVLQGFALRSECPLRFQGKLEEVKFWTVVAVHFHHFHVYRIYNFSCSTLFQLYIFGSHEGSRYCVGWQVEQSRGKFCNRNKLSEVLSNLILVEILMALYLIIKDRTYWIRS